MQRGARRLACLVEGLGVDDGNRSVPNDSIIYPAHRRSSSGATQSKPDNNEPGTIPVSAVINQDASWPTATALIAADSPSDFAALTDR